MPHKRWTSLPLKVIYSLAVYIWNEAFNTNIIIIATILMEIFDTTHQTRREKIFLKWIDWVNSSLVTSHLPGLEKSASSALATVLATVICKTETHIKSRLIQYEELYNSLHNSTTRHRASCHRTAKPKSSLLRPLYSNTFPRSLCRCSCRFKTTLCPKSLFKGSCITYNKVTL